MTNKEIEDYIYKYHTQYERGFTREELLKIKGEFPAINDEKFNDALMVTTGMVIDGNFLTYHVDLVTALRCGLQNRDMYGHEFD